MGPASLIIPNLGAEASAPLTAPEVLASVELANKLMAKPISTGSQGQALQLW